MKVTVVMMGAVMFVVVVMVAVVVMVLVGRSGSCDEGGSVRG